MEIIWHGHSCFELVSGGFSLVLDPYCHRELCGYPELDLEADAVLCSHGHYGHGWTEAVSLRHGAHDPFEVETLDSFHDVMGGRLRGELASRLVWSLAGGGLVGLAWMLSALF